VSHRSNGRWRVGKWIMFALATLSLGGCWGPAERPTADFAWCPDGRDGLLDYWFVSTSSTVPGEAIVAYRWEFEQSGPVPPDVPVVSHRFPESGLAAVTLSVTDSRGIAGTTTKHVPVELAAFIHSTWQLTLGYPPTVSGIVENRYERTLSTVVVRAKFFDSEGMRLSDGRFEVSDLAPGEKAAFAIQATAFSSWIFHATVDVESFVVECPWIGLEAE